MKQKFLIVMCVFMFCIGAKAVRVTIDGLVYEFYVKQNYAEVVDGNNNAYAYIPSKVTFINLN